MDAKTGVEQGDAISAEVAPNRKACKEGGNSSNCKVASNDGRFNLIRSSRLRPMTMATTDAVSGSIDPSAPAPADPKSLPAKVADRPKTERAVARPIVNIVARKRRV